MAHEPTQIDAETPAGGKRLPWQKPSLTVLDCEETRGGKGFTGPESDPTTSPS